ncbi:MAG TPA: hypothetical protein VHO71_04860 [Caproiciproducens sp.]|nr:hypothetical protein [Caproiciproducens sp.]
MLNSIWIELHQEMPRHPKTLALAQALKISRHEAVGILADLWTWGLSCAGEDGNLRDVTDIGIAMAVDFPVKKAQMLAKALISVGWIDQREDGYCLHDWQDYTSRLSEKRRDAERKRTARKEAKQAQKFGNSPKNVQGLSADCPDENSVNPRAGITQPAPVPIPNQSKLSNNNNPLPSTEEDNRFSEDEARDFSIVAKSFTECVKPMPSSGDTDKLMRIMRQYGVNQLMAAIQEAQKGHGHSVAYVQRILEGWERDGKSPPDNEKFSNPEYYKNAKW